MLHELIIRKRIWCVEVKTDRISFNNHFQSSSNKFKVNVAKCVANDGSMESSPSVCNKTQLCFVIPTWLFDSHSISDRQQFYILYWSTRVNFKFNFMNARFSNACRHEVFHKSVVEYKRFYTLGYFRKFRIRTIFKDIRSSKRQWHVHSWRPNTMAWNTMACTCTCRPDWQLID